MLSTPQLTPGPGVCSLRSGLPELASTQLSSYPVDLFLNTSQRAEDTAPDLTFLVYLLLGPQQVPPWLLFSVMPPMSKESWL